MPEGLERAENWVVLGDSLTEGVGFSRHSFVSELVRLVRKEGRPESTSMTLIRLRAVGNGKADRFIRFGYSADIDQDPASAKRRIWIWNLASEGTTIDTDLERLPFIETLRPSVAIVFRGPLDSIVRPAAVQSGRWPFWVPKGWRQYAATDPRCYFSTTWWRRMKQQTLDWIKQRLRLRLLRQDAGAPLRTSEAIASHADRLFASLRTLAPRVVVCGMLPVSEETFPGSRAQFDTVSRAIRAAAEAHGCEFLDWDADLIRRSGGRDMKSLFYRDGFHPNREGSALLAEIIRDALFNHSVN